MVPSSFSRGLMLTEPLDQPMMQSNARKEAKREARGAGWRSSCS